MPQPHAKIESRKYLYRKHISLCSFWNFAWKNLKWYFETYKISKFLIDAIFGQKFYLCVVAALAERGPSPPSPFTGATFSCSLSTLKALVRASFSTAESKVFDSFRSSWSPFNAWNEMKIYILSLSWNIVLAVFLNILGLAVGLKSLVPAARWLKNWLRFIITNKSIDSCWIKQEHLFGSFKYSNN